MLIDCVKDRTRKRAEKKERKKSQFKIYERLSNLHLKKHKPMRASTDTNVRVSR